MDCSLPGSSVHGIFRARVREWVAISFSKWQIDGETIETVTDFISLGSKVTVDGVCSHEMKRCLLLRRKTMTNPKVNVKVTQWCPTLYDSVDYTVHGILQARILEWVVFPLSRGSSQPRD